MKKIKKSYIKIAYILLICMHITVEKCAVYVIFIAGSLASSKFESLQRVRVNSSVYFPNKIKSDVKEVNFMKL